MTVKVRKPQDLQALYTRAISDAAKQGISWSGDMRQGRGSGFGFEGSYIVDAEFITITVLKKPLLISKSRIEKEVMEYVNKAG